MPRGNSVATKINGKLVMVRERARSDKAEKQYEKRGRPRDHGYSGGTSQYTKVYYSSGGDELYDSGYDSIYDIRETQYRSGHGKRAHAEEFSSQDHREAYESGRRYVDQYGQPIRDPRPDGREYQYGRPQEQRERSPTSSHHNRQRPHHYVDGEGQREKVRPPGQRTQQNEPPYYHEVVEDQRPRDVWPSRSRTTHDSSGYYPEKTYERPERKKRQPTNDGIVNWPNEKANTFPPEPSSAARKYGIRVAVPDSPDRFHPTSEGYSRPAEPINPFGAPPSVPHAANTQHGNIPAGGRFTGTYDMPVYRTAEPSPQPSSEFGTTKERQNVKPPTYDEEFEAKDPEELFGWRLEKIRYIEAKEGIYRERLGLEKIVKLTPNLIGKAYTKKAFTCHPDKAQTKEAHDEAAALSEAKTDLIELHELKEALERTKASRKFGI